MILLIQTMKKRKKDVGINKCGTNAVSNDAMTTKEQGKTTTASQLRIGTPNRFRNQNTLPREQQVMVRRNAIPTLVGGNPSLRKIQASGKVMRSIVPRVAWYAAILPWALTADI